MSIPRLGLLGKISFLVDTGADQTILMPADGLNLRLDYAKLTRVQKPVQGIGGEIECYEENAIVAFNDPGNAWYLYKIKLLIPKPNKKLLDVPSLLGRDLLDNWRMCYAQRADDLSFQVERADCTIPV